MNDSGPTRPSIELWRDGTRVATYPLDADRVAIGRSPSNSIRLESMAVSRIHAAIERRPDGSFVLIDLESHCGTLLNGRRVRPLEPVLLSDFSTIRLAEYELIFHQPLSESRQWPGRVERKGDDDRYMIMKSFVASTPCRSAVGAVDSSAAYRRLLEVSRILGGGSDLVEQLQRALDDLLVRFPGAEGGLILAPDENGTLAPLARSIRDGGTSASNFALSSNLARQALAESAAMLVFSCLEPIRAWLCVPLLGLEGSPVGLIQLFSFEFWATFGALQLAHLRWDDLDRLAGLTESLGLAMEFHRIEQQAGDAACRQIQASLDHVATRVASRELPGYDFDGLFVPGREFRASFREFIPHVPDRVGGESLPGGTIVMGEVAGKGIRAALIMADVQLEIRRLLLAGLELPDVLSRVNWLVADAGGEGNCVSVTLVDVDCRNHRLTVVNAGHDPLVVRRSAVPVELVEILGDEQQVVGPPLGITPDPSYETISTSLSPGDYVFLTSNASTRYLDFSGPHSVRLRQRTAIHPPSKDVALFCFGRK